MTAKGLGSYNHTMATNPTDNAVPLFLWADLSKHNMYLILKSVYENPKNSQEFWKHCKFLISWMFVWFHFRLELPKTQNW